MFGSFLKSFDESLKDLNEEEAIVLFERVKGHLIDLQRRKLAELEIEEAPILDKTRYKPRKRMPPKHIGYFATEQLYENGENILVVWSKWSQGRPPRAFEGLSVQLSDRRSPRFVQSVRRGFTCKPKIMGRAIKIIKSNMGYDADGRSLDDFSAYRQKVGRTKRVRNFLDIE